MIHINISQWEMWSSVDSHHTEVPHFEDGEYDTAAASDYRSLVFRTSPSFYALWYLYFVETNVIFFITRMPPSSTISPADVNMVISRIRSPVHDAAYVREVNNLYRWRTNTNPRIQYLICPSTQSRLDIDHYPQTQWGICSVPDSHHIVLHRSEHWTLRKDKCHNVSRANAFNSKINWAIVDTPLHAGVWISFNRAPKHDTSYYFYPTSVYLLPIDRNQIRVPDSVKHGCVSARWEAYTIAIWWHLAWAPFMATRLLASFEALLFPRTADPFVVRHVVHSIQMAETILLSEIDVISYLSAPERRRVFGGSRRELQWCRRIALSLLSIDETQSASGNTVT